MPSLLPPDWQVPAVFSARLGNAVGRQRAMLKDGHLLLVLHQPPEAKDAERRGRLFWRDTEGTWRSTGLGDGPQALKKYLADFAERVDVLERQWQEAQTAADYYALLQTVAPLHRTARNLYATLQQAREAVPEDRDLIDLRDRAGEIERSLELLHGDAKNGLDFTVAFQSEQQSRQAYELAVSAHRLNLLAALFFPIATLAAIFGMNLHHGLEPGGNLLFWGVLGFGLASGLLLVNLIARKPAPIAKPQPRSAKKRR